MVRLCGLSMEPCSRGTVPQGRPRRYAPRQGLTKADRSVKPACKPGSVGAIAGDVTIIPLGPQLPAGSSHLPADSASSVVIRLFGVAPGGGYRAVRVPTSAVRSYRTVSPLPDPVRRLHAFPAIGGLLSVALFIALGPELPPGL